MGPQAPPPLPTSQPTAVIRTLGSSHLAGQLVFVLIQGTDLTRTAGFHSNISASCFLHYLTTLSMIRNFYLQQFANIHNSIVSFTLETNVQHLR